jgi:hypothetical protein
MTMVADAVTVLDRITAKKNVADSALVDLLAHEKDLSAQVRQLTAEGVDPIGCATRATQCVQSIEDTEAPITCLTDTAMPAAKAALTQAKLNERRAIMREQVDALPAAAQCRYRIRCKA